MIVIIVSLQLIKVSAHGLQFACSLSAPSRVLPTAGVPMGYIAVDIVVLSFRYWLVSKSLRSVRQ